MESILCASVHQHQRPPRLVSTHFYQCPCTDPTDKKFAPIHLTLASTPSLVPWRSWLSLFIDYIYDSTLATGTHLSLIENIFYISPTVEAGISFRWRSRDYMTKNHWSLRMPERTFIYSFSLWANL